MCLQHIIYCVVSPLNALIGIGFYDCVKAEFEQLPWTERVPDWTILTMREKPNRFVILATILSLRTRVIGV